MSDLVSVIVPIYNVEKFLPKCINSLINQTFDNIEIILVDDGSLDNCGVICDDYARHDSRIKVIHKVNGGLSDARNVGIDAAKGEYFLFVDSDDYINFNMIQILYDAIKAFSAELAVCRYKSVTDSEVVDMTTMTEPIEPFIITDDIFLKTPEYYKERKVEFTVAWNKLYSRKLFENIRYPIGKVHEDEFTTYKLIYAADNMVYVPCELYYYVQRGNSIMSAGITKKRLLVLDAIIERMNFYESKGEMGYWERNFEYYRMSYLRYLGVVNISKELSLRDFDKYKDSYRLNMNKYFFNTRNSMKDNIKVWLTGICPYIYAQILRRIHG